VSLFSHNQSKQAFTRTHSHITLDAIKSTSIYLYILLALTTATADHTGIKSHYIHNAGIGVFAGLLKRQQALLQIANFFVETDNFLIQRQQFSVNTRLPGLRLADHRPFQQMLWL
jgi:hypothetical protein